MSDTNFSDLSALTAPASTYFLLIEDPAQPAGVGQFFRISVDDFAKVITKQITDKAVRLEEVAAPTAAAGQAVLYIDSTSHTLKVSENNGSFYNVANLTQAQTFTNKTLTAPTIADFTNAAHDHGDADDGGALAASITLTTPTIASFTNATHNHSNAAGGGSTLSSPTIVTPTIASFVNANHNHSSAALGGVIVHTPVALTDANPIVVDASLANAFKCTLTTISGSTRVLGNPSGAVDGQVIVFRLIQDGTGSQALTLGTKYEVATGITVTLSTAAKACDYLTVQYDLAVDKFQVLDFRKGLTGAP